MEKIEINGKEYRTIHSYLRYNYKKRRVCDFCKTTSAKSYHHALKKEHEYSKDINSYFELCKACHAVYDNGKAIAKFDLQGNKIAEYKCTSDAFLDNTLAKNIKVFRSGVSECLNGKRKSSYGFVWKFVNESSRIKDNTKYRKAAKLKGAKHFEKPLIFIADGVETKYKSLTEASNETGVSITAISNNLVGLSKSTLKGVFTLDLN